MEIVRDKIETILSLAPAADALEFERCWWTWGQLAAVKAAIEAHTGILGANGRVAVLMRNRPEILCATLACIGQQQCIVTINPIYPDDRVVEDLDEAQAPIVIASTIDWQRDDIAAALVASGALCLEVRMDAENPVRVRQEASIPFSEHPRPVAEGVAVEMLTSGTTGKPKRVPLKAGDFQRSLLAAAAFEGARSEDDTVKLRSGVSLISNPFAHTSGLSGSINVILSGRKACLLEKFRVEDFVDALTRHRPKVAGAPPAALRMLMDASPPADTFASLLALRTGTAPLDPDLADAYFEKYGIPVLQNYGATEFGGVAGWTIGDFKAHRVDKRGSVGRLNAELEGRAIDGETGQPLGSGEIGVLQLKGPKIGDGESWLTTTDMAKVDADRFVFILGRADNAIIRGGFKVHADDVRRGIERHPDVIEAAVVGIPDRRLGQVPVAACVVVPGSAVTPENIIAFARNELAPYQVPVQMKIVADLPRTSLLKVSEPELRALFLEEKQQGDA